MSRYCDGDEVTRCSNVRGEPEAAVDGVPNPMSMHRVSNEIRSWSERGIELKNSAYLDNKLDWDFLHSAECGAFHQ